MLLIAVERKEFTNFVSLNSGRGAKMFEGGGQYRICGVVSSNYTWPTYRNKVCQIIDDSGFLYTFIDTGRTGRTYGNNLSWDIDTILTAVGNLYFYGTYYTSPNGWKFNGFVERVG